MTNDERALYDEAVRQVNAQVNTINDLEAARDHLRARLRRLAHQWEVCGGDEAQNANVQYASALDQCAADLLAVLTEQLEEKHNDQSRVDSLT